jgi:glycosyltransferase involved in cell wall biosynthesis
MLACISKNDRARLLFAELKQLNPAMIDLGYVRASRFAKGAGALSALTLNAAQLRTDMDFSPIVAKDMQRQTEEKIRRHPGISHVLQWGAMYAPVARGSRLPYSIVTDGPYDPNDPLYPVEWRPVRWSGTYFERQRAVYCDAAHVFTLSTWARNKLLNLHGLDPNKVVRIGWGPMFTVDAPNMTPADPPYFVSIGNEWYRKGMDIVAEAGHKLHLRHPQVTTVIAGEPRGLSIPTLAGVRQIRRCLAIEEVKKLLAGARALIVASRFDASPHIIMEALQLGTPVIGSDVCGIPEPLATTVATRVVASGNIAALTDAMAHILVDDVQVQRQIASSLYVSSHGWERTAGLVLQTISMKRDGYALS